MYASIVVPTFDERESLPLAVDAVRRAMGARADWEVVVVDDDSPDRTWQVAEEMGRLDPRVRVIRRVGRRGLSSAILEGLAAARGDRLLVMDADLQHDVSRVPHLLAALDGNDLAVGTRYAPGGSTEGWSRLRRAFSGLATGACRALLGIRARDPMSGFFAIRRPVFLALAGRVEARGFKTLMQLLYHHGPARVAEVPYAFSSRRLGDSKLGASVAREDLRSLLRLVAHRLRGGRRRDPPR